LDPQAADLAEGAAPAGAAGEAVQRLEAQVAELERQATDWKDRALRGAADLDNYRRRAIRERDEALSRGQSEVLNRIIEVVDDLARVAHLDPANTTSQALHDGMLAIERKFQRVLESSGVERIDPAGAPFDPNAHEAVTMMPAPSPETDNTVGAVFQPGYRLRGVLLRPAKVAVMRWSEPAVPNAPADLVQ
jgi:molecular chaperone GrpE